MGKNGMTVHNKMRKKNLQRTRILWWGWGGGGAEGGGPGFYNDAEVNTG